MGEQHEFLSRGLKKANAPATPSQLESIEAGCARLGVAMPKVKTKWDAEAALDDLRRRETKEKRKLSITEQLRLQGYKV